MKGTLTGCILEAQRLPDGSVTVKLAGVTANDKRGVTWILQVLFLPRFAPTTLPEVNSVARIECMATHEVFTVRGEKASRVRILGVNLTGHSGTLEQKGKVQFLKDAVNEFVFGGHLIHPPTVKDRVGVTEARVGVVDRKEQVHYFNCEAWREQGVQLATRKAGAELEFRCILRRDRVESEGRVTRVFDVMEVQAVRAKALTLPRPIAYPQAAD